MYHGAVPVFAFQLLNFMKFISCFAGSWQPRVSVIGDNLAVNLTWRSRTSLLNPVQYYIVQFRYYVPRTFLWSKLHYELKDHIAGNLPKPFCYITNKQPGGLEANRVYQFRVQTYFKDSRKENSAWSANVSFTYIIPVPPLVNVAQRLSNGTVLIKWSISRIRVGFSIDHFILLFRKEKRLTNGETGYTGFHYAVVPGYLEEYLANGLDTNSGYQVVVYGVYMPHGISQSDTFFTGGKNGRRITAFSQEVFVPADSTKSGAARHTDAQQILPGISSSSSLLAMNSSSSNSLMFLILGVLAGFMLLVILSLFVVCVCRQQREKIRLITQSNGDINKVERCCLTIPSHKENNTNDNNHTKTPHSCLNQSNSLGFLLSELTPIAVANFRTATVIPLIDSSVLTDQNLPTEPCPSNEIKYDCFDECTIKPSDNINKHSNSPEPQTHSEIQFRKHSYQEPGKSVNFIGDCGNLQSQNSSSSSHLVFENRIDMKREPPSGGSVHNDTDSDDNNEPEPWPRIKPPYSVFLSQMPFSAMGHPLYAKQYSRHSGRKKCYSPVNGKKADVSLLTDFCQSENIKGSSDTDSSVIFKPDLSKSPFLLARKSRIGSTFSPPNFLNCQPSISPKTHSHFNEREPNLPLRLQAIVPHNARHCNPLNEQLENVSFSKQNAKPVDIDNCELFPLISHSKIVPESRFPLQLQQASFERMYFHTQFATGKLTDVATQTGIECLENYPKQQLTNNSPVPSFQPHSSSPANSLFLEYNNQTTVSTRNKIMMTQNDCHDNIAKQTLFQSCQENG